MTNITDDKSHATDAADAAVKRILVIDDEKGLRDFMSHELGGRGYEVCVAVDAEEAMVRLQDQRFDLVISDVRMPGMDGIALVEAIKRRYPHLEVLLTTGYGTVEGAVEAMKRGAFDFLLKPVETEHLAAVVRHALMAGQLKSTLALYRTSIALSRTVDPAQILPLIADLSRRLLNAERVALLVRDGEQARIAAEAGGDGANGLTALLHEICARVREEPEDAPALAVAAGTRPVLVQPLTAGGAALGFLVAARAPDAEASSPIDHRHAVLFAVQAAQTIRNAGLSRELARAVDLLAQSEKLQAAGHLAAGIAHEISTPLSIIMGNTELALEDSAIGGDTRVGLEHAMAKARQCRDVVASLLDFVRPHEPFAQPCDLYPLLESAMILARLDSSAPSRLTRAWTDGSPRVLADPVHVKQIVVNLVRNALQAVAGHGLREVVVRVERACGRVRVSVEDSGPGVAPGDLPRLFEPFFTTKEKGQGTGLGLYLCRMMAERNGGTVRARNGEGGGAVFTLELPEAKS